MFLKFINRMPELHFLEERYQNKHFEFFVVYGRRRVGKTELVKEFISRKPHLYFLCDKAGTLNNLVRLKRTMAERIGEPVIASEDWDEIFIHFMRRAKEKKLGKMIIVLDEFPYLVEKDDAVPSIFQRLIDEIMRKEQVMLILLGSSISMMEWGVLSAKSPLYGRKTAHLKLEPIRFSHYGEFFPKNFFVENMEFHAVLGGIPFYLVQFSDGKSASQNIIGEILGKTGHLYEEVDFLLKEEFREADVYRVILGAIGSGASKLVDIANKSRMPPQHMDKYLKSLMNIGLIQKEIPVTEKKTKRTIYSIRDNFFSFWFTFCEPYKSDIALGELSMPEKKLRADFNTFVAGRFERLVRDEFARRMFPQYEKFGKWWGHYRDGGKRHELEIDLVALNEEKKEILFGECKWKEQVNGRELLEELRRKSQSVLWNNHSRKEKFVLFARSFQEKWKVENVFLVDLKDLEKLFKS